MLCPKCNGDSLVVFDSRPKKDEIRRRRKCNSCGYKFTTYEITEVRKAKLELALQICKENFKNE